MRFVVSLLGLRPGRIGGTESYLRDLVGAMPGVLRGDEVVLLLGREAAASIETPGLERVVLDLGPRALVARRGAEAFTPWRDREVEGALAALGPDAVFFPQFSMYPKHAVAPSVVHVADVQHLLLPGNFALVDRAFRAAIYPWSLAHATLVIAASRWTAGHLSQLAGIDASRIRVVHHAAPLRSCSRRGGPDCGPAPVDGRYLYFPAATNAHKGHDRLLEGFARVVASSCDDAATRPQGPLRLVLTGQRTALWRELERRIEALGLAGRVLHLGFVERSVVEALYHHAEAVVFPTRFEGFGLPVIEAAAHGVKVVASDLDVFGELGVTGLERIDFDDPSALGRALASPSRAGLAADTPTWSDAAAATIDVLREAAGKRGS